jgi:hypothetical protein
MRNKRIERGAFTPLKSKWTWVEIVGNGSLDWVMLCLIHEEGK